MNVAEHLRAAAANVRRGWCQGVAVDENGRGCAINAMVKANEGQTIFGTPSFRYLKTFLDVRCLHRWNDAPGRTAEEVATAMEDAAFQWEVENCINQPVMKEESLICSSVPVANSPQVLVRSQS